MTGRRRSSCPIAFGLDLFGDRWTLLVLRDLIFEGKTRFRELVDSGERIATNVLAERLDRLVEAGVVVKVADGADRRRFAYAPTKKGLDLVPTMLEIVRWSAAHDPRTGAPPEFVKELERDREGAIRRVRARFESAAPTRPPPSHRRTRRSNTRSQPT